MACAALLRKVSYPPTPAEPQFGSAGLAPAGKAPAGKAPAVDYRLLDDALIPLAQLRDELDAACGLGVRKVEVYPRRAIHLNS